MKKLVLFLVINTFTDLGFCQVNCLQDSIQQFQDMDTTHIKNYVRSTTMLKVFDSSGCMMYEFEGSEFSYVEVFERTDGMNFIGLIGRFVLEENIFSLKMIEGVMVVSDSESKRESFAITTFL